MTRAFSGGLWAEAIKCASYVINMLPPRPCKIKSPHEIIYEEKPDVSNFRVFGSICHVHVPKLDKTKLDAKAKKCLFDGYDAHRKCWRCIDPVTKKFTISRDVVFDEISSFNSDQRNNVLDVFLDNCQEN